MYTVCILVIVGSVIDFFFTAVVNVQFCEYRFNHIIVTDFAHYFAIMILIKFGQIILCEFLEVFRP